MINTNRVEEKGEKKKKGEKRSEEGENQRRINGYQGRIRIQREN